MKVKELIKKLKMLDQEAEVVMMNCEGDYISVTDLHEDEAIYLDGYEEFRLLSDYSSVEEMREAMGEDYLDFISICLVQ